MAGRIGRTTTTCRPGGRRGRFLTSCSSTSVISKPILSVRYGGSPQFSDIDVSKDSWPALVATVGFEAMRNEARGTEDPMAMTWKGGADTFFYKGDSGRWRGVLAPDDLALYETAASALDLALRMWLEGGRHAVGI